MVALGALALSACGPDPARLPEVVPQVVWPTLLGNAARAGYAQQAAPDSGRVAWSTGLGRGLLAPPIVVPPLLFMGTSNRVVQAISTENGHEYWERHLDGAVGAALVAGNGLIYAASQERDGVVYAMEPSHGRVRWRKQVGYAAAAPLLLGDTLIVPLEQGAVLALRASGDDGGARLWAARLPASPATSPVAWGDVLVLAARNDSVYALRRRDGGIAARAAVGGFASATPALAGDTLYLPLETGGILALKLPGLERLFLARLPGTGSATTAPAGGAAANPAPPATAGAGPSIAPGAAVLAAPVVAGDGSVYFLDAGARLGRIAPGAATASLLADLGGAARASLTLTRDGLLVGRLDGTLALVRFDGRTSWSTTLDGSIAAPAAVVDGVAYVPLERGRIVKVR